MATEYFHLGMGEWTESELESTSWNQYYMSRIATKAELSGRHSARKTTVQKLCRSNITDSMVMQVTGHKNIQSLNAYKKPFFRTTGTIISYYQQLSSQSINKHCHTFSTISYIIVKFYIQQFIQCDHEIEPENSKLDSIEL